MARIIPTTRKMENEERSSLLRLIIICVNTGNSAPSWSKMSAKVGIRKMVIPRNTRMAITSTVIGYPMAAFN